MSLSFSMPSANRSKGRFFCALLAGLLWVGLAAQSHGQARATATVTPNPVMVGQTVEYTVSFINTSSLPNLIKPRVEGLQFSDNVATSTYQTIVNGSFSSEKRLTWSGVATREGSFTIPARTVDINGQSVEIPAARLEVVPPDEESRSRAFLQLELPEGPYYVGQALEARLILLVRVDLNITNISFPQRNGEAFINSEFNPEPERARTRLNGRLYNAFFWDIIVTPIKSGPASIAFSQSIAIQVPNTSNDRFQGFLNFNVGRTESLLLESATTATEVRSLPTDERPDSFNGAIGSFSLQGEISAPSIKVGEPLTLTLRLSGKGNFDRISAPVLPESADWRLYPPKSAFAPSGTSAIDGVKSFEYILIPQSTAPQTLPPLAFSYFDPEGQRYEILPFEPPAIEILPADPGSAPVATFGDPRASDPTPAIPEALLPIRPAIGSLQGLQPLWQRPKFIGLNLATALLLLFGGLFARRRKALRENQHLARRHAGGRKLRSAIRQAETAAKANQPEPFFRAARTALQECAAQACPDRIEAHSLVPSDCLARLASAGLPDSDLQAARELLDAADAHHFAGQTPDREALAALCKGLISLLSSLNKVLK